MKKRVVLNNVPTKLPVLSTVFYTFLLSYYEADRIWWGIFIAVSTIYWIIAIIAKYYEKVIDITELDKFCKTTDGKSYKSKFQERLDKAKKERNI